MPVLVLINFKRRICDKELTVSSHFPRENNNDTSNVGTYSVFGLRSFVATNRRTSYGEFAGRRRRSKSTVWKMALVDNDLLYDVLLESLDWISEKTGYPLSSIIPSVMLILSTKFKDESLHSTTNGSMLSPTSPLRLPDFSTSTQAPSRAWQTATFTLEEKEKDPEKLFFILQDLETKNEQVWWLLCS